MLLFALTPLLVPCACVDPGTNGTSDAAIDHTATLTADGVRVDFDLRVPDGATNVRLALGDGTTLTDPVQPQHLYPLNATLEVRLNWDGDRAGTVAETLVIDQNPVPLAVLGLPVDAPGTLVAVDHYGFNHNYDPNEPAYPVLFGASAAGWTAGAAGSTAPIANLSIDFYPSRDGDPVRHAVPAGDTNAYLDLMEPHVRIPNWYIDEVQVHAGGFSMPQVNGTSAPEPDLPKFLQNAHFPVDEPLGLALASSVTGAAHRLGQIHPLG